MAYQHVAARDTKPARDANVWLRYVDDFERRHGEWRIARRVCVFEWGRIDAISKAWRPWDGSAIGQHGPADPVFARSLDRH